MIRRRGRGVINTILIRTRQRKGDGIMRISKTHEVATRRTIIRRSRIRRREKNNNES